MNSILYDLSMAAVGAVLGVIITLVISKINENRFNLLWYVEKENVIINGNSKVSDLKVTYKGIDVEGLSVITIALWNHGRKTVHKSDFAIMPTIKLQSNYVVYSCKIIDSSNRKSGANGFKVQYDVTKKALNIGFDYIAQNQGVVIQVLCDVTSECSPVLYSEIKEGRQISEKPLTGNLKLTDRKFVLFQGITFGVAFGTAVFAETFIHPFLRNRGMAQLGDSEIWGIIFLSALVFIILLYSTDKRWRMPKQFRKHFVGALLPVSYSMQG